mgnify:CR=1 FL=1
MSLRCRHWVFTWTSCHSEAFRWKPSSLLSCPMQIFLYKHQSIEFVCLEKFIRSQLVRNPILLTYRFKLETFICRLQRLMGSEYKRLASAHGFSWGEKSTGICLRFCEALNWGLILDWDFEHLWGNVTFCVLVSETVTVNARFQRFFNILNVFYKLKIDKC